METSSEYGLEVFSGLKIVAWVELGFLVGCESGQRLPDELGLAMWFKLWSVVSTEQLLIWLEAGAVMPLALGLEVSLGTRPGAPSGSGLRIG